MSDYTELKRLAEAAQNDNGDYVALNDYGMAMPPAVCLALIADLDEARNGMKYSCAIRLKKEIERLESEAVYSAAGFDAAREEIARLKAENKRITEDASSRALRSLRGDCQDLMVEREELKAEIAGLRTGYEAYEQVNAELKAEVEGLRNALRPLLAHWDDLRPGESLNVDAARAALGQGEQS